MEKINNITLKLTVLLFCAMTVTLFVYAYINVYNVEIFKDVTIEKYIQIEQTMCEIGNIAPWETPGISENNITYSLIHSNSNTARDNYTLLNCSTIFQNPTLPNGCEITSATIVLRYLGYSVSKENMSDIYLDKQSPYYQVNPNVAYMGNPRSDTEGWYCFPPVIVKAINRYFNSNGYTKHIAKNCTGASVYQIREYIDKGYPVICWSTLRWGGVAYSSTFKFSDGTLPYSNLHCVVVSGYYTKNLSIYYRINDPLWGTYDIDEYTFERIFRAMGNRCVVILDK